MRLMHQMDRKQSRSLSAKMTFRDQREWRSQRSKQERASPASLCRQAFVQGISEGYKPLTLDGTAKAAAAGVVIFWGMVAICALALWISP
jgi:hypothetical protein